MSREQYGDNLRHKIARLEDRVARGRATDWDMIDLKTFRRALRAEEEGFLENRDRKSKKEEDGR